MQDGNSRCSSNRPQSRTPIAPAHIWVALGGALLAFGVLARDPGAASRELQLAPAAVIADAPVRSSFAAGDQPARKALVSYLSRRYRIAGEAAAMLIDIAYATGDDIGVDPLLILAVIAIESRFNPIAESDSGAKGLMQVIPRYHLDKLEAKNRERIALSPAVNIELGSRVLKEYIDSTGSVEAGLQKYNGSLWDGGNQYAQKILAERTRFLEVLREQFTTQRRGPGVEGASGHELASNRQTTGRLIEASSAGGSKL